MQKQNRHIDNVKIHFNRNALCWNDLYQKCAIVNDIVLDNRKNICVSFLQKYLKSDSKILDAGCGAGLVALEVVQKGFFIHGIDISLPMIKYCEQNFLKSGIPSSKYLFTLGNIIDIDFPKGTFDGIIALGFLEYQENESQVLEYFHKILRPGGKLIISGPIKIKISNFFGLAILLRKIYSAIKLKVNKDYSGYKPVSINKYSLSRFKKLLKYTGFTLIDYKRHGYSNFEIIEGIYLKKVIGYRGERFLFNMFNKISDIIPIDRFANDIIVVGRANNFIEKKIKI